MDDTERLLQQIQQLHLELEAVNSEWAKKVAATETIVSKLSEELLAATVSSASNLGKHVGVSIVQEPASQELVVGIKSSSLQGDAKQIPHRRSTLTTFSHQLPSHPPPNKLQQVVQTDLDALNIRHLQQINALSSELRAANIVIQAQANKLLDHDPHRDPVGLDSIQVRCVLALSQAANFQSTMFNRIVSEGDTLTSSSCRRHRGSVLVSVIKEC